MKERFQSFYLCQCIYSLLHSQPSGHSFTLIKHLNPSFILSYCILSAHLQSRHQHTIPQHYSSFFLLHSYPFLLFILIANTHFYNNNLVAMQSSTEATTSQVLDYQITQKKILGKGAYSKVYLGQSSNGSKAAIKKINKSSKNNNICYKLAKQQQNILGGLNSSYTCSLIASYQEEANYYLILKYCEGKTLAAILKERKKIPFFEALIIFRLLIKSLQYILSKNIMHRDLKPENIIYHNEKITVIDFGFACRISKSDEKLLKERVGTPIYMSPEIMSKRKYNSKSDIWSLGVILYEMVHGYPPYQGKNQEQIAKRIKTEELKIQEIMVSEQAKGLIKKCLAVNVEERISWNRLFQWAKISKMTGSVTFEQAETPFCRCWG